ncbi:HlyD family secretion protein [Candidatus Latescibacterota bacterium]
MNKLMLILMIVVSLNTGCLSDVQDDFTGSGTFETQETLISAQVSGEILSLGIEEGDRVSKGQILAEIDVEHLALQRDATAAGLEELKWNDKIIEREIAAAHESINQANAGHENIGKTRERLTNLYQQGASTRERLDSIETEFTISSSRLQATKNHLEGLKAKSGSIGATRDKINAGLHVLDHQIGKGSVTSPVDGIIIEKYTEIGELAAPGAPICSIADLSSMWLTIYIGEEMLGKVKIGNNAKLRVDSHPGQNFTGKVTWISSDAEFTPKNVVTKDSRVDLVYAVKIIVDNSDGIFKIGMPADAFIEGL